MQPATAVTIGAGQRGQGYAFYTMVEPKKFQVVGVAEPIQLLRDNMKEEYKIKDKNVFDSWEKVAALEERIADIAIICTQDRMHKEPAIK